MDYYKAKDNSDLVRDPSTGAILNTNSLDYDKYVAQRDAKNVELSLIHISEPTRPY